MGIGAEDRIDEFSAETGANSQRNNQGCDCQSDADQRDPRHNANPTLGTPGAEVSPRDHPLKSGKGGGSIGHGCSCSWLAGQWG